MDLASPKTFRVSQQAGHSERANVSVQILRQEKSHSLGRQLRRMFLLSGRVYLDLQLIWWGPPTTKFSINICRVCFKKKNWNIIALQCCVSFWCAAKWISHTYIYPFSWISFLFRSPQSIELSSLCRYSGFSLVIYFTCRSVCISMSILVSQVIPLPSPPWYQYVCSLRLCLYFCFANKFIYTIFLVPTYLH